MKPIFPSLAAAVLALGASSVLLGADNVAQARDGRDTVAADLGSDAIAAANAAVLEDGGDPDQLSRGPRGLDTRVDVTNHFAYQSNAELDGRGGEGDFVWFPAVTGSADYRLSEQASLEGRASLQSGIYADLDELDFWGVAAEALARRELTGGWSLYGGAEAYDYQSLSDGDGLTRGIAPGAGLAYARYYPSSRTYATADLGLKHHYTSPSADERDEASASFGVSHQLGDRLYAQAYYAYRYSNYEDTDRRDHRHAVGLALLHAYGDAARASIGVSFADNDSNTAGADYQTINITLGTTLSWQF
ncbi:MAG: outer membrane beta-barrel protein [Opitutaceae bacterium]|jgi:hypothetical protein|nr:outer membrane beta-barrel protein [Opitutaceae bacterium]